jgi:hypothetical protein
VIAGDTEVDQGDTSNLVMLPKWEGDPFSGRRVEPQPIDLGRGLRLERLNHDEAERVLTACLPRGHFFVPVRQFGQMYSLVAEVETEPAWNAPAWNAKELISDALAMSRLVLDNGYSYEYAAQVFDHEGGEQHIRPALLTLQHTYRVRKTRDWLTDGEAEDLRALLNTYWSVKNALPERVQHALWLAEYVVTVRWLDVIAPLLVVAFEALTNTSKSLVELQFKTRVPALAEEVGAPISTSQCDRMYDVRSRWVHGRRVSLYERKDASWEGPTDDQQRAAVERIAKMQDALRAVLRRCIEDAEFRAAFAEDEAIRSRWPVAI